MITGHIGVAFAIRSVRRDAPLPALLAAAVLPDIVDMAYAAVGFCSPYGLYSHSLPAIAALTVGAFVLALALTRKWGVAVAIAAAVLLHLPADLITGEKMLWPGGPIAGLVLYDHPLLDFLLEVPILYAGWRLLGRDQAQRKEPRWATARLSLGLLIAVQATFAGIKLTGRPGKPSGCIAGTMRTRAERDARVP